MRHYLLAFLLVPALASAACYEIVDTFDDCRGWWINDVGPADGQGDCIFEEEISAIGGIRMAEVIIDAGVGDTYAECGGYPGMTSLSNSSGIQASYILTYGFYATLGMSFDCPPDAIDPRWEMDIESDVSGYAVLTLWSGCAHQSVTREFISGTSTVAWPDDLFVYVDIGAVERIELRILSQLGIDGAIYELRHTAAGGAGVNGATQQRGGLNAGDSN